MRGGRTRRDEQKRDKTTPVGCYRRVMIVLAFQLLSDLALKALQPLCPIPAPACAPPALCHLLGHGTGAVRRGRGVGRAGQAVGGRCGSWGLWWGFLVAHPTAAPLAVAVMLRSEIWSPLGDEVPPPTGRVLEQGRLQGAAASPDALKLGHPEGKHTSCTSCSSRSGFLGAWMERLHSCW